MEVEGEDEAEVEVEGEGEDEDEVEVAGWRLQVAGWRLGLEVGVRDKGGWKCGKVMREKPGYFAGCV